MPTEEIVVFSATDRGKEKCALPPSIEEVAVILLPCTPQGGKEEGFKQVSLLLEGDITAVPIPRSSLYSIKKWLLVRTPSTGYKSSMCQ
jgi:hypothetical protein